MLFIYCITLQNALPGILIKNEITRSFIMFIDVFIYLSILINISPHIRMASLGTMNVLDASINIMQLFVVLFSIRKTLVLGGDHIN